MLNVPVPVARSGLKASPKPETVPPPPGSEGVWLANPMSRLIALSQPRGVNE